MMATKLDHKPFTRQEIDDIKAQWDAGQDAIDTETGNRLIEEVNRLLIAKDAFRAIENDDDPLARANPGTFLPMTYSRLKAYASELLKILDKP